MLGAIFEDNKKTAEDSVLKGLNYEAVISLNTTNSGLS